MSTGNHEQDPTQGSWDFVVVGGGSTGGVTATRLAERGDARVLLLEAGPDLPDHPRHQPSVFSGGAMLGGHWSGVAGAVPELDWGYESEELPGGRRIPLLRGKLVGGSGMANGCVFVQGRPEDFERWVAAGAVGWCWDDVKPYYDRVRQRVPVMTYPPDLWLPLDRLLVEGMTELGFRYVEDMDDPAAWDGVVGPWPRNRHNEIRQASNVTYVRGVRAMDNFAICDHALVDRVLFEGSRAVGVSWIDRAGSRHDALGNHIVLSAGGYGTAPILLRSGVGPAAELRALGIEPRLDLPVGRGLMDHPVTTFVFRLDPAHVRLGWPVYAAVGRGEGWWTLGVPLDQETGLAALSMCRASTEGPDGGVIQLRSADPAAPPHIFHGYRQVVDAGGFDRIYEDWISLRQTPSFRAAGVRDVREGMDSRSSVLRGVGTGAHPAGGCQIGSVLDTKLAVLGADGLSVADASIFPRHVTNNPNFTCFMVGERAADILLGTYA